MFYTKIKIIMSMQSQHDSRIQKLIHQKKSFDYVFYIHNAEAVYNINRTESRYCFLSIFYQCLHIIIRIT